jgi:GNAT superfamily N-acetyltransferase
MADAIIEQAKKEGRNLLTEIEAKALLKKAGIADIVIVVGYKSEKIIEEVNKLYPDVVFVQNKDFTEGSILSLWRASKQLEGDVLIMDADNAVGMGALRRLEDEVGEVKRMFIQPDFQGKGYGKLMMVRLMDKARELGYRTLRLDTGRMLEAAVHVYKSVGFREIAKYPGTESHGGPGYIYMEKSL